MQRSPSTRGFTLTELTVTMSVASIISIGLMIYGWTSSRLIARNFGVNRSHETVRFSNSKLRHELNLAYSEFSLINATGPGSFDNATASPSLDIDPASGFNLSERANGVRYRTLAGGPFRLAENVTRDSTILKFEIPAAEKTGGVRDYEPKVGDLVLIPLVKQTLTITQIIAGKSGSPETFTVKVASPIGYDFQETAIKDPGNPPPPTTGYFLRAVAFTTYGKELRYHPEYPGPGQAVRTLVTSPKPFALLCPNGNSNPSFLHVSLESHDTSNSERRFKAATSTLQTMISPRPSDAQFIGTK